MMPRDSGFTVLLKGALFGADIGFVYAWDRTDGGTKVPGSDGPFPNGLALTADEQLLFIKMYLGGEVRKLDLDRDEVVGVVEIDSPDNSTWSSDGRLLVASHIDGLMASTDCQGLEAGSCGFAFRIVALDPETLATETLIEHRGAPMGGATVALEMEGDLFLGTFAGDRVTRVPGGR
jgi:sugar lactone lactonase YvrE